MTSRPSTAAPILVALSIAAAPLVLYVAGYFWLGAYRGDEWLEPRHAPLALAFTIHPPTELTRVRAYRYQWQTVVFHLLAVIEGRWAGINVELWEDKP